MDFRPTIRLSKARQHGCASTVNEARRSAQLTPPSQPISGPQEATGRGTERESTSAQGVEFPAKPQSWARRSDVSLPQRRRLVAPRAWGKTQRDCPQLGLDGWVRMIKQRRNLGDAGERARSRKRARLAAPLPGTGDEA